MKIEIFKFDKNKYKLTKSNAFNKRNKHLVHLAKFYDSIGYIDKTVGKEFEGLFDDPSYVIGVHYTGSNTVTDSYIDDIFLNGVVNKVYNPEKVEDYKNGLDIEETVKLCPDLVTFIGSLKTAHDYKESQGCFILKIPKSYLWLEEGEARPIYYIYYSEQSTIRIGSEYVYGYVPVSKDGIIEQIIHNGDYTDRHSNLYISGTISENRADKVRRNK